MQGQFALQFVRHVAGPQLGAHVEAVVGQRHGTRIEQVPHAHGALTLRGSERLDAQVDGFGRNVSQQARGDGERSAA